MGRPGRSAEPGGAGMNLNKVTKVLLIILGFIVAKKYGKQLAVFLDEVSADPAYFRLT